MNRKLENLICGAAGFALASGIYFGSYYNTQKKAEETIYQLSEISHVLKNEYDIFEKYNKIYETRDKVQDLTEKTGTLLNNMEKSRKERSEIFRNIIEEDGSNGK